MKKIKTIFIYIFVTFFAIITVFPFIYMIFGGLMTYEETTRIPPTFVPGSFKISNYLAVFNQAPFARYFFNTFVTATTTTVVSLFTSILGAFAMANLKFKGKGLIKIILISLLMVPGEAIIFTNYTTIMSMGLINTYIGLVIPFLTSIFYMYYLQSYFKSITPTVYKAAMIDGTSDWEYIWRILVPMSKSGLITVALLSFISGWNAFLWPLLVTNESDMRLLNNGLAAFATEAGSQTQLQLAAATLIVLPILIVYFVFRKQIIRGVVNHEFKA